MYRRLHCAAPALVVSERGLECNHLIGFHETWTIPWDVVTGVYPSSNSVVLRVATEAIPPPRLGALGRLLRLGFEPRAEIYIPTACVEGVQTGLLAAIHQHAPAVRVWQSKSLVRRRAVSPSEALEFLGL